MNPVRMRYVQCSWKIEGLFLDWEQQWGLVQLSSSTHGGDNVILIIYLIRAMASAYNKAVLNISSKQIIPIIVHATARYQNDADFEWYCYVYSCLCV